MLFVIPTSTTTMLYKTPRRSVYIYIYIYISCTENVMYTCESTTFISIFSFYQSTLYVIIILFHSSSSSSSSCHIYYSTSSSSEAESNPRTDWPMRNASILFCVHTIHMYSMYTFVCAQVVRNEDIVRNNYYSLLLLCIVLCIVVINWEINWCIHAI